MNSELLKMQIAFIFIGILLVFIGFVSKTQNAGDMINGFDEKKHDKEKVSKILGNRNLSVSRELTKKYEEVFRGSVDLCIEKFNKEDPRGEFIIVIEGVGEDIIENEL